MRLHIGPLPFWDNIDFLIDKQVVALGKVYPVQSNHCKASDHGRDHRSINQILVDRSSCKNRGMTALETYRTLIMIFDLFL